MRGALKFELVGPGPLGSGGRGDVYLGYVREQNQWVAVKYLRDYLLPHQRQAFLREIDMLAKQVPGVVKLLDFNKRANPPYYVMEYLSGGNLRQYAGRLPEGILLPLATALATVLGDFHANCGAHGDYKPDNIIVGPDGKLKLGDPAGNGFGFSVLLAPARGGTPGYWAPEIRKNGVVSSQADVFSFGATLWHLATGQTPADSQIFDPHAHGIKCPQRLRDAIVLCTQPNPKTRPSMRQVARFLAGESWESIRADALRQVELQDSLLGLALTAGLAIAVISVTRA
jgi:serine/threonine protein kinase